MPTIHANGIDIYYERHGEGEPLLLHPGFGCTVEIYWANAPELSRHFRVIVLDPRGAGRSSTGDVTATPKTYADDAVAVLDAEGIDSAHVFATSFGGMMAQHIALEHPKRVRRLVLGCTTAGGTQHVLPPMENMAKFIAASEITDPIAAVRSTYALNYSDEYVAAHDAAIVARSQANAALRSTPEGRATQINAIQLHDTQNRLGDIACPTLVAHGTDDGTVPVENGRVLAAGIRGSQFNLYPGGRHLFFMECAQALNADIIAFLRGESSSAK